MKRLVVAIVAALPGTAAHADETRERVMTKIADVIAIERVCPALAANYDIIQVGMLAFKIDMGEGTDDFFWLQREIRKKIAMLNDNGGRDAACLTGRILYGPKGKNGPDMLLER